MKHLNIPFPHDKYSISAVPLHFWVGILERWNGLGFAAPLKTFERQNLCQKLAVLVSEYHHTKSAAQELYIKCLNEL